MNHKWIISIAVAAIIIVAAGWLLVDKNPGSGPSDQNGQRIFNPKKPNFTLGQVTYVDDKVIYFSAGGKIWTAETTSETKFLKQVKDAKGVLTNAEATRADIKLNQNIVVYFSSDPVNQVYKTDKIQIISQ